MKEPHTALFIAPAGVGKTHLALSLLENEYRNHFDFIVIICPTLRYNSTYKFRGWVWNDPEVIPIEPGNQLYYLIEKISNLLAGSVTLFLIDDIIADEALDKRRQPLFELAQGWISPYKFLVPCMSLRAKFTNQQINGKSRTSETNMVLYVIYF